MSFLSFSFAIFLGIALLVFHLAPARWRPSILLGLSYGFYLSWSVAHAVLLAGVTAGVYATALWMERRETEQGKKRLMGLGVSCLLLLLLWFKSATWIAHQFFAHPGGWQAGDAALLLIPLGLSYYVFKMVGYLLDVYWEVIPAQRSFVSLALYGSFFPQIVSGPIQRAESFFEQVESIKSPAAEQFLTGLRRILFGLVKKIVIADQLAAVVGNVHASPGSFSSLELLAGAYCYSVQLYMDFSGITDIAIGIGLLFGVKGPENFDLPYYAANIQAFWRRWHMSLTTWLTDYLFTPLRMSFRNLGAVGLCLAIFVNMVAIGVWHGFTWSFLAFGIVNGVFMIVSVLTLKPRNAYFKQHPALARVRQIGAPLLTFHLVVFTHILFRSESFTSALQYTGGLLPGIAHAVPATRFDLAALGISASTLAFCVAAFAAAETVTWAAERTLWTDRFLALPPFLRHAGYAALAITVLVMSKETVSFIYARF